MSIWQEQYRKKVVTAQRAISLIRPGARIFIGTGCGQPQTLVDELVQGRNKIVDAEIYHLLTRGTAPYIREEYTKKFRTCSFFLAPNVREGIVSGRGTDFYVGSLVAGAIYKGNLRSGAGSVLVPQQAGRYAVGLAYDERTDYLYVAGLTGQAYVYNATTGEDIATIQLAAVPFPNTFINDCIVTKDAVYFTDMFLDVYYRVALLNNGRLPDPVNVEPITLSGDFAYTPGAFNGNGIVATPNGKNLIIGNSDAGLLYLVHPLTGVADEIDLGGVQLPGNDGLVLQGKILYVVQNFFNQISVVKLSSDYTTGEVVNVITHPAYDIPATAALFGSRLYAVNARFNDAPPPIFGGDPTGLTYNVIGVPAK